MTKAVPLEHRGVLAVGGSEAREFLQGLVTNNVDRVSEQQAVYAALLSPQGKFLFDFFIVQSGDELLLDVDRERLADLLKKLTLYRLRADVTLEDRSDRLSVVAFLGEVEALNAEGSAAKTDDGIFFADPRHAGLGARAILDSDSAASAIGRLADEIGTLDDYEELRLSLSIPDGSRDFTVDKTLLMEAGFDALHGVDFRKGCYVGQELTARTKYRGNVKRKFYPVHFSGQAPVAHSPVLLGEKEAGVLTSAAGNGRGMAYLRIEDVETAAQTGDALVADGVELQVDAPVAEPAQ